MKRKYVAVIYDDRTQNNLRQWCNDNNFDLGYGYSGEKQDPNKFEFHTTVFYTSNVLNDQPDEPGYRLIESHKVIPARFDLLGEDKDIPVIKLEVSGMLAHLRREYESRGFKDQWSEYIPHISLSYARRPVSLGNLTLPSFPLTFNKVKVEDIIE